MSGDQKSWPGIEVHPPCPLSSTEARPAPSDLTEVGREGHLRISAYPEISAYLEYARVENGLASNSLLSYRRDLRDFLDYLRAKGKKLRQATREDIRGFPGELYRRQLSSRSAARHLV